MGKAGIHHAERWNVRGKANEREMEKNRKRRKLKNIPDEIPSKFLIVEEVDGGGCFGLPTYHVYGSAPTLEDAQELIGFYRWMYPREGLNMKIVSSEINFLER